MLSVEAERDAARAELSDALRALHAEQATQRSTESKHEAEAVTAAVEIAALRAKAETFTNEAKAAVATAEAAMVRTDAECAASAVGRCTLTLG